MLDIEQPEQLLSYLRAEKRLRSDESPQIINLRGGVSNKTVLVRRANGESWVIKQALGKLRVEVDWFSDPARINKEALGLQVLPELAPGGAITPLIFQDEQNQLLAMEAVAEPHENFKTMLLRGEVDNELVRQFGELIGVIHRRSTLRPDLAEMFADRSFFESLRIEPYYRYAAEQVPEAAASLMELIERTYSRRLCLVHGDYSPKNILVREGKLILLDHEVIHFGNPAFDLGFALAHLISKAHHLLQHRQKFAEAVRIFWNAYVTAIGQVSWKEDIDAYAAWHGAACLLARVAGRSKLEYLSSTQRLRQKEIAAMLLRRRATSVLELLERFLGEI